MPGEKIPARYLPRDWWTAMNCAEYLGIKRGTWTAYVSRDQAPKPDSKIGRSNVWRPQTVITWSEGADPSLLNLPVLDVVVDQDADTAYIHIDVRRTGEKVARTQSVHPRVNLDFAADGSLLGVEIL